jgi:glycosyltransferase involved in cell wall biosynthesis
MIDEMFLERLYENLKIEIDRWWEKVKSMKNVESIKPQEIGEKANNSEILASIVTPSYNAIKFLPFLYQSLISQTLANKIEWIIVDDCSTDNSIDFYSYLIRNDTKLGKIKIYRNEQNVGAALTLKRAFELSSGNVVFWVSADDFYVSNDKVEKDLMLIKDGYDCVFSKEVAFGESPKNASLFSVPTRNYKSNFHFLSELYFWNYLPGSSICLRKDVYNQLGGLNEFLINVDGDFDLIARMILLGKRIGFSDTTVFITQHQEQTSKAIEKMVVGTATTRLSYIRFLKNYEEIGEFREFLILQWFEKSFSVGLKESFSVFELLRHSTWFEELTDLPYFSELVFKNFWSKFHEKNSAYKEEIKKLSSMFLQTPVFRHFSNEYISRVHTNLYSKEDI